MRIIYATDAQPLGFRLELIARRVELDVPLYKVWHQIFPYSSRSAYSWAEAAFRKCQDTGVSPETLREQRSPGITQRLQQRPPRYFPYP